MGRHGGTHSRAADRRLAHRVTKVDAAVGDPQIPGWPAVEQRVTNDPAIALGNEVDETNVG